MCFLVRHYMSFSDKCKFLYSVGWQMGRRPQLPSTIEDIVSGSESATEESGLLNLSDEELKIMKQLVELFKSCTELIPQNRPTALEALRTLSRLEDTIHLTIKSDDIQIKADDRLQAGGLSDEQSCVEENSMDNCPIEKDPTKELDG
jgi:hypothetical protein